MNTLKIVKVIKNELKLQGFTYADVAKYFKMTEAGVKKLLSKSDISLSKLSAFSELLNISVAEIIKNAENEEVDVYSFNSKDIKFFMSNQHFFHFFMKLAYEQRKPIEIQKEFNLSPKSLNAYLKKLEELNLIKRHPYDRTQIVGGIPLAIKSTGTDLEKIKYDIAIDILLKMKKRLDPKLRGAGLYLSHEEIASFEEKILNLVIEYSNKSRINRRSQKNIFSEYTFMNFIENDSMFKNIIEI